MARVGENDLHRLTFLAVKYRVCPRESCWPAGCNGDWRRDALFMRFKMMDFEGGGGERDIEGDEGN